MKTIQLLIACFIIFSQNSFFAQSSNPTTDSIQVKETEIDANNIYIISDASSIAYSVRNNNNQLMNVNPSFLYHEVIPPIHVVNQHTIDDFVRHYFKPYFSNHTSFTYFYLYFYLFADISGNIQEIEIRYPKNIGIIPISVIELFETSLLKSDVQLSFDKNNSVFRGSRWVGRAVMYEAEKLKDL